MIPVGFSTGCLYQTIDSVDERIALYLAAGADAIEIGFATPQELFDYELTENAMNDIKKFRFATIHAPFKEVRYGNTIETKMIIDKLRSLCDFLPIKGLVIHPDKVDDFAILKRSKLPFLIENMDKNKQEGILPEHIKELKKEHGLGFVLDIQHVYEHDPTMGRATEFVDIMGDGLHHLHVSGQTATKHHISTCMADNKEAITKVLEMKLGVPIILEGVFLQDIEEQMKEELAYVREQSQ